MNQHSYITPAVLAVVRQTVIPCILMDTLIALYAMLIVLEEMTIVANPNEPQCSKVILLNQEKEACLKRHAVNIASIRTEKRSVCTILTKTVKFVQQKSKQRTKTSGWRVTTPTLNFLGKIYFQIKVQGLPYTKVSSMQLLDGRQCPNGLMYPYQMVQMGQRKHYKGFQTYFKTMKRWFYSLIMMKLVDRQHKNVQNCYRLEKQNRKA